MCHFYANPLSVLLSNPDFDELISVLDTLQLNAIRALPSMKAYVEEKLTGEDAPEEAQEVRRILFDDGYLREMIPQFMDNIEKHACGVRDEVVVLEQLCIRAGKKIEFAELYLGILVGDITCRSALVRELLQFQTYSCGRRVLI
jgi:hypothetical protein